MKLQTQDWITANAIQQELERMLPNDPTIKAFANYLPAEARYQEQTMAEEAADEGEDSYYDEESDGEASGEEG